MSQHTISVLLTGNPTSLRGALLTAGRDVDKFGKQVNDSGKAAANTGQAMKAGLAAGVLAIGVAMAYSIGKAAEFDRELRNVQSITKVSDEQLRKTGDALISMSTRLPQAASTLAAGLYDIASSGFAGADGMKVLEASAVAASAGLTTTATSAKTITAVLNAYGRSANDAADVSDVLFQAVNLGVVTFEELSGTIGDVVGTAAAATVGIDEVSSAIATMTLSGISAAEAGTSLNRLIQSLLKPSAELAQALHGIGYESGASALETDTLSTVIDKLRIASQGNIETLLAWFPEIRAARGALALMAAGGENYRKTVLGIEDAHNRAGATQKALNEQMKSLSAQWALFKNRVDAGALTLGTRMLPMVIQVLHAAQNLGSAGIGYLQQAIRQLDPFLKSMGDVLGDVADITEDLVKFLGPAAKGIAGLVGVAVIQTLNVMAAILSDISGFIADHPALFRAAAIVIGGVFLSSLAASGAATAVLVAETTYLQALYAKDAIFRGIGNVSAALQILVQGIGEFVKIGGSFSEGILGMKMGLGGLVQALGPTAMFAVFALTIGNMVGNLNDAHREAKALREEFEKGVDWKAPDTIIASVDRMKLKIAELRKTQDEQFGRGGGPWNVMVGGIQSAIHALPVLGGLVDDTFMKTNVALGDLTKAERENLQVAAQLREKYDTVANQLGTTSAAVQAFVQKHPDLDPLVMGYDDLAEAIKGDQVIAEKATPKQVALAGALGKVADATSDAKDEVEAFQSAIDALVGTELDWFDAQTKAAQAWDDFTKTVKDSKGGIGDVTKLFDTSTEAGRSNRDAISSLVSSYSDMAGALANKGDMEGAIQKFRDLDKNVRTFLGSVGLSKTQIDALMTQLGLVEDNYNALVGLTGDDVAAKDLEALQKQLGVLDDTVATPEIKVIDASKESRATVDAWIQYWSTADPTTRVYVDDKPALPSQEALERWANDWDESSPEAIALLSVVDPQGKFKTLKQAAANYDALVVEATATLDSTQANKGFAAIEARAAALEKRGIHIPVGIYTTKGYEDAVNKAEQNSLLYGGKNSRMGNITAYAAGGITPAHIARGEMMKYGEPETGGEAYIPRRGSRSRSLDILETAAQWYGMKVVPMAMGGILTGYVPQAPRPGTTDHQDGPGGTWHAPVPDVRVIIDGTGMDRSLLEWLRKSIRVEGGGNVQVALGQGGTR